MKIFQEVRRDLIIELALCKTPRDVARVLELAEITLKQSGVTGSQKQGMWEDVKHNLGSLLRDEKMSVGARSIIDQIIKRNKWTSS